MTVPPRFTLLAESEADGGFSWASQFSTCTVTSKISLSKIVTGMPSRAIFSSMRARLAGL